MSHPRPGGERSDGIDPYREGGYIESTPFVARRPPPHPSESRSMSSVSFQISGMNCGHCVAAVRRAIESVSGAAVTDVQIGRAVVEVTDFPSPVEAIKAAIEDEGYHAEVEQG
jgi:copper chaperone